MSRAVALPRWAEAMLAPAVGVTCAFLVAGLVVVLIGENPLSVSRILVQGALGSGEGIGFTLYYATNFVFTGLAVAVAVHAGLFNIGGEGQAILGGIGAALACLKLAFLPAVLLVPAAILAAALFGGAFALLAGWLQARRGSHVVITTIMLNFIAATLIAYLLVGVMGKPGSMSPETETIPAAAQIPFIHDIARGLGLPMATSPLNLTALLALAALLAVWLLIFRSRLGFAIRTVGANPHAALYAGIKPGRVIMIAMAISGALAGGFSVNEVMGVQHRLVFDFSGGYGFAGIAVALMGRSHPVGIALASVLFGILYQGGAELAFETATITRDMIILIGGIVILFAGALDGLFRRLVALALMPALARPGA